MFLSLTSHGSAVSRVILLSCPRDRWVLVNLRGNSDVSVWTHTHSPVTRLPVPNLGCLSARVCTNECVGTLRSSGGSVPFPHPSLPIISRPDKTPVCWRLQDQTVMSRQLSSQHTADARWLSLSWVPGYMQCASGGQLIRKRQLWCYMMPLLQPQWLEI